MFFSGSNDSFQILSCHINKLLNIRQGGIKVITIKTAPLEQRNIRGVIDLCRWMDMGFWITHACQIIKDQCTYQEHPGIQHHRIKNMQAQGRQIGLRQDDTKRNSPSGRVQTAKNTHRANGQSHRDTGAKKRMTE